MLRAVTVGPADFVGILLPANGGTGIANNNASTITISGAFALALTLSNTTALTLPVAGTLAILGANTFTGTQTFADGAAWASTGLSDAASYSTASTAMFNLTPTWSYSSTASGLAPFVLSPTMIPTGASSGNVRGVTITSLTGTSSIDVPNFNSIVATVGTAAGYSGTIANGSSLLVTTSIAGTAITNLNLILGQAVANGNGTTTATITNIGLNMPAFTAAGGVGGTIANKSVAIVLSTASSASTTNTAVEIAGNGGAASTNYAIRSTSTAQSQLAGNLTVQSATAIPAGGTAAAGVMLSSTANFGVFFGSSAPTLSAAQGSLYLRSDGTTINNRAYINTNGSTTWTPVTTVG